MSSQGPLFPTTGTDNSSSGTVAWSNPGRITADDGSSADALLGGNAISHYIQGVGFGFTIPAGATIQGIQVDVKCESQGGGGGQSIDNAVFLLKAGAQAGANQATGSNLPTGALAYVTYGGPSNLWGTTWTQSDINNANFGVIWQAKNTNGVSSSDPLVDAIRITITYTGGVVAVPTLAAMGVGQ